MQRNLLHIFTKFIVSSLFLSLTFEFYESLDKYLVTPDFTVFFSQLLDVFGHKSNISLVFDFMETDLEVTSINRECFIRILHKILKLNKSFLKSMFDWNSFSSPVRKEGVTWEVYTC